jgi:hypothetical protein
MHLSGQPTEPHTAGSAAVKKSSFPLESPFPGILWTAVPSFQAEPDGQSFQCHIKPGGFLLNIEDGEGVMVLHGYSNLHEE